jgi:hypothetical protein
MQHSALQYGAQQLRYNTNTNSIIPRQNAQYTTIHDNTKYRNHPYYGASHLNDESANPAKPTTIQRNTRTARYNAMGKRNEQNSTSGHLASTIWQKIE